MPQSVPFRLARLIAALALPAAVHAAPPLSLDEALRLAESRSAQLSAQRSAAEASASMALTAGENPDPVKAKSDQKYARTALTLSLIHISEPTRPY